MPRLFFCGVGAVVVLTRICNAKPDGLAMTPPSGWSSWYAFGGDITEVKVLTAAANIKSAGLLEAGYEYINLDDAWMATSRTKFGKLQGDPIRFPSGMKSLGDKLHSMGFKFGLYGCPGPRTCMGYPGQFEHEFDDAQTLASFGIDFWKYDNCWMQFGVGDIYDSVMFNASAREPMLNLKEFQLNIRGLAIDGEDAHPIDLPKVFPTRQSAAGWPAAWTPERDGDGHVSIDRTQVQQWEAYKLFGEALAATGRNITYSICPLIAGCDESIFNYYSDIAHMSMNQCKQLDRTDSWASFTYHVDQGVDFGVAKAAKPGYWNDKDFLQIGHKNLDHQGQNSQGPGTGAQTYDAYRSEIAIYAVMAAPLIFSADVSKPIPVEMLKILTNKHVLRVDRDALGLQGDRVGPAAPTGVEIYSRQLTDGEVAVVALNRGPTNTTAVTVTWTELGIDVGKAMDVTNVWTGKDEGRMTGSVKLGEMASHGNSMVILSPPKGRQL